MKGILLKHIKNASGFIMVSSYVILVLLTGLIIASSIRAYNTTKLTMHSQEALQAIYAAQSGVEQAKKDMENLFSAYFYGTSGAWSVSSFSWFDDLLSDSPPYTFPITGSLSTGAYRVDLTAVYPLANGDGRDIVLRATGTSGNISRTIEAVVRFGLKASKVFDYAYFINNFGWFWGSAITANGDVRSNGDFSFRFNPKLNGNAYAAINTELGSSGNVSGTNRHDSWQNYLNSASDMARPGNPTAAPEDSNGNGLLDEGEDVNGNGLLDTFDFEYGYDGQSVQYGSQEPVPMPYLGDLDYYKTVVTNAGGQIKQGGSVVVDSVLDGDVVLTGTPSNPIEITGPVVVTGDVLIKGTVTGQGTIYAGRNIHILGNIVYKDPPAWPKPDINPGQTMAANETKDFLGLAAKGNIVVGDYTEYNWGNSVKKYIRPPFTGEYSVHDTDAVNGYVKYYKNGQPYFDGNYTSYDGGKKSDGTNRRFYESSLDDYTFASLADSHSHISRIDAFMYTNHAFTGKCGSLTINGGIVSRDEAVIFSGSITMNYDPRIKQFRDSFYLPKDLAEPEVVVWKEL